MKIINFYKKKKKEELLSTRNVCAWKLVYI